jgi:protein-S-isoprenylcysteine O-methyltransferase Ste14
MDKAVTAAVPTLILMLCIWTYWSIVGAMSVRRRKRTGGLSGVMPEQPLERLMWALWIPLVAAWCILPWQAWTHADGPLAVPAFALEGSYAVVRWGGALLALAALVGSIRSWREMGRNWTMSVTNQEAAVLITHGMFSHVRHPIYALSIALMLATLIVVPNVPVVMIAVIHITLIVSKAINEERFMLATHGERYANYCRHTGRFLPRGAAAVSTQR